MGADQGYRLKGGRGGKNSDVMMSIDENGMERVGRD